jgi:hypothetical protein
LKIGKGADIICRENQVVLLELPPSGLLPVVITESVRFAPRVTVLLSGTVVMPGDTVCALPAQPTMLKKIKNILSPEANNEEFLFFMFPPRLPSQP